jgi:Spy/CpxP family protein refolding chaperone
MTFDLSKIDLAAIQIQQKLEAGELSLGCAMSTIASPVIEAWDLAHEMAEGVVLTDQQRQKLLNLLDQQIRQQMETTRYDDFDLIFERLVQLVSDQNNYISRSSG